MNLRIEKKFIAVEVNQVIVPKSKYKNLSEVEANIKRSLSKNKKNEYAKNILEEMNYNLNWEELANSNE